MQRRKFLKFGVGTLLAASLRCPSADNQRPNIVFILADDLGWRDLGCYGSNFYETPNIDRLAQMGMRFTNAYAANPLCSPTRASILTGQYPCRLRITTPNGHLREELLNPIVPSSGPPSQKAVTPQSRNRLPFETYTLAEALCDVGYRTAHFGKWHLGWSPYNPENHGFDFSFPPNQSWPGPPNYFAPFRKDAVKDIPELRDAPEGKHIDEIVVEQALNFIRQNRSRPFFVNLWLFSVHAPFQGREDLIAKYRQKSEQMPNDPQRSPIMGAMIEAMDNCVGMFLRGLEEMGLMDNTIIIFTSDNGGNMYDRVGLGHPPTNNAPLRNGKASLYEGGTRVPLIVVWKGHIKPNSVSDAIVSSIDFYPTLVEIAGAKVPKDHVFDGVSLLPVLLGRGSLQREAIFCHFPHYIPATGTVPGVWVRKGDWKLIRFFYDNDDQTDRFELYNLREDIGETNNLADKHPELVRELNALIDRHLQETQALVPVKNPKYRPPVAGWQPSQDARLSLKDGVLIVESTGGDPFIFTNDVPKVQGTLVVKVRMASQSKGIAQVNWATEKERQFSSQRKVVFNPVHDGQWHEYEVRFTCDAPLFGLRLDPCSAPGIVQIDWIRLVSEDGKLLRTWEFEGVKEMPEQAKIIPPEPDGFLPLLLKNFQAPDAPFQPDGEWDSVYRLFLIGVLDAPQYREWRCHPAGALRLSRKPRPDGNFVLQVEFMAHQSLEAHARSFNYMQAEILCADDDASSLLRWRRISMQLTPKGEPIDGTKLEMNGEVTRNGLVLRYSGRERKVKTPLPITCDWAIFDLVQRLSQRLGEQRLRPSEPKPLLEFALLEDLEFLRTNHRIFLSEPLEVTGDTGQGTWNVEAGEKRFRWRRFVQFGDGVLPWTYCLDKQHRLVLAYSGMRAYLYDPTAKSVFPFRRDKGHGAGDR